MTENSGQNDLLAELTADVVSAYVSNNPVPASDLPGLISEIHNALGKTLSGAVEEVQEKPRPAVNPKRSVTDDYIICLEDGQKFKSLKRHLMSHYGMTPEEKVRAAGVSIVLHFLTHPFRCSSRNKLEC